MTPTHFFPATDLVVVGFDPKCADYDNPRGEILGFQACVYAANDRGDTRVFHFPADRFESAAIAKAEKLAAALTVRLEKLGKLPVGFAGWATGRPIYGSDAYVAYGQADDLAWERREAEEESWR